MADANRHAALTTEIARLRELQLADLRNATFVGWTPELLAAHEKREHHIGELRRELVTLSVNARLAGVSVPRNLVDDEVAKWQMPTSTPP